MIKMFAKCNNINASEILFVRFDSYYVERKDVSISFYRSVNLTVLIIIYYYPIFFFEYLRTE